MGGAGRQAPLATGQSSPPRVLRAMAAAFDSSKRADRAAGGRGEGLAAGPGPAGGPGSVSRRSSIMTIPSNSNEGGAHRLDLLIDEQVKSCMIVRYFKVSWLKSSDSNIETEGVWYLYVFV